MADQKNNITVIFDTNTENRILDLTRCNISSINTVQQLALWLDKNRNLISINLTRCKLQGLKQLAPVLQNCCDLQNLKLNGNSLSLEASGHLSNILSRTKISTLELAKSCFTGSHLEKLSDVLTNHIHLRSLMLQDNNLKGSGACLKRILEGNRSLIELNISGNKLTTKDGNSVAEALQTNTTLRKLDISRNRIKTAVNVFKSVLTSFKNNTVTEIKIEDNGVGSRAKDTMSAIRGLLQANVEWQNSTSTWKTLSAFASGSTYTSFDTHRRINTYDLTKDSASSSSSSRHVSTDAASDTTYTDSDGDDPYLMARAPTASKRPLHSATRLMDSTTPLGNGNAFDGGAHHTNSFDSNVNLSKLKMEPPPKRTKSHYLARNYEPFSIKLLDSFRPGTTPLGNGNAFGGGGRHTNSFDSNENLRKLKMEPPLMRTKSSHPARKYAPFSMQLLDSFRPETPVPFNVET